MRHERKHPRSKAFWAASVALSLGSAPLLAAAATAVPLAEAPASSSPAVAVAVWPQQPDNSRRNSTSGNSANETAQQQSNQSSDVQITAKIRRALVKNKSLSLYAHNVKIITQDGRVTLKGPVKSEEERQAVIAAAQGVAGNGNITDNLTVKGQ